MVTSTGSTGHFDRLSDRAFTAKEQNDAVTEPAEVTESTIIW